MQWHTCSCAAAQACAAAWPWSLAGAVAPAAPHHGPPPHYTAPCLGGHPQRGPSARAADCLQDRRVEKDKGSEFGRRPSAKTPDRYWTDAEWVVGRGGRSGLAGEVHRRVQMACLPYLIRRDIPECGLHTQGADGLWQEQRR
eukprot:1160573-Pelagomonas_calceolata.AAC.37